jgi:hypothetical protein
MDWKRSFQLEVVGVEEVVQRPPEQGVTGVKGIVHAPADPKSLPPTVPSAWRAVAFIRVEREVSFPTESLSLS